MTAGLRHGRRRACACSMSTVLARRSRIPYTGVLAIFSSRLRNGQRPMIFEDGEQRRDFVHVGDVARAFCERSSTRSAVGEVFNIGSGQDRSVKQVAQMLAARWAARASSPRSSARSRIGDIRHCFCDGSKAADLLGFRREKDFDEGLAELAEWVASRRPTIASTRRAPNSKCRGWWHERRRPPDPDHRRRRLHRLQPRRPARRRRASRSSSTTRCRGPASSETSPG